MSTRRGFFQQLVTVGSGLLVAPSLFLPKSEDRFRWKVDPKSIPNPEWINGVDAAAFPHLTEEDVLMFNSLPYFLELRTDFNKAYIRRSFNPDTWEITYEKD